MAFYDVAIVGGGPAGLTAAATLAHQLHTDVVFDSHNYRNAKATQEHMVPGHEGKDPAEFRRESREGILSHYSPIKFQDAKVTKGYEELWAVRIFHCLFCKGYEDRGAPSAGVLAVVPIHFPIDMLVGLAIQGVKNSAQLSERVTLYTNGNEALTAGLNAIVKKDEWSIEPRPDQRLAESQTSSVTVKLEDGSSKNKNSWSTHL
ncbi:hypothetical protein SLS53_008953 [Cytospora paraplurivora]|uniref:FAD/NAD(P)-binding domain-containing protein n=1 Tax=Cytospora paraplurivora TaxID=2898453 RepID=A0AAN9U4Q8_9PEZI